MCNYIKKNESYFIAFFATIVRYYDYALFGLSASIISTNLMPGDSDSEQMLIFFAMFSIAVIARPLGSIFFGRLGDYIGRVQVIKASTILAAIATSAIAFIPTYSSIGVMSVILLTLCRMCFLFSLAGEIDAIKIYVVEKISKKYRHMGLALISFSSQIGVFLASITYFCTVKTSNIEYLWRINFLLGGAAGIIIFLLRNRLKESEIFLNVKKERDSENAKKIKKNSSYRETFFIISQNKMNFFIATLVNGLIGSIYHFSIIFLNSFLAKVLGIISLQQASYFNIILIATYSVGCLFSGFFADRHGSFKQMIVSLAVSLVIFNLIKVYVERGQSLIFLQGLIVFLIPFYSIPLILMVQSLFNTNIKMRMCSLSHSIGSMIISSTVPFMGTLIWHKTNSFAYVVYYGTALLAVLLAGMIRLFILEQEHNCFVEKQCNNNFYKK